VCVSHTYISREGAPRHVRVQRESKKKAREKERKRKSEIERERANEREQASERKSDTARDVHAPGRGAQERLSAYEYSCLCI